MNKYMLVLMSVIIITCSNMASAYDFIVDGICYNILSQSDLTCKVTSNPNHYEGSIEIPDMLIMGNIHIK